MKLRILSLLMMIPFISFAGDEPTDWTLFATDNGVEIYYKYAECDLEMGYDHEWVLLKFVNTTSTPKKAKANIALRIIIMSAFLALTLGVMGMTML